MTDALAGTRRERLRAQTLTEIKEHALAQLAAGGPEALSLNGISRAMRMSGPALYRYFASRDELLAALVVEAYEELADALQEAAGSASRSAGRGDPEARFRAVARAYRAWARANPHRYQLIFASRYGSGLHVPERTVPAAHRSMRVVLGVVADLTGQAPPTEPAGSPPAGTSASPAGPGGPAGPAVPAALGGQLEDWADSRPDRPDVPPEVLHLGVLSWTRMHGLVSLEIAGTFTAMHLDPGLLYGAEIDQVITQASRVSRAVEGIVSVESEATRVDSGLTAT